MPKPPPIPSINARVHGHLEDGLDAAAVGMHATRLVLNSAALWWS
jgi:hypothetical protein